MCGICGTAGFGSGALTRAMADAIAHRGPDDDGYYADDAASVYLANRRLSIIDVEGGKQPILSEDGAVVVVQNGEIYNFRELRRELEDKGHRFLTHCDTEAIVHLYEEEGERFVERLDGMFAIALWDRRSRKLLLARDSMGIKPLLVWQEGERLAFGSEAKALLATGCIRAELDLDALHFLLNIRFVPGERTLFRGIRKLAPGTVLTWHGGRVSERRYWRLDVAPDRSIRSVEDCAVRTRDLLDAAVRRQMVSDVPLGLSLSGGMDSSALVALSSAASPVPVSTFTLGFNEPTDELGDARLVAQAFGTNHHEATVPVQALALFPRTVYHLEEPKENALQLDLLSGFAKSHVKVLLSGLGGDELFGGYRLFDFLRPTLPGHQLFNRTSNQLLLEPLRRLFATLVGPLGSMRWDLFKRAVDLAFSLGVPERSYLLIRNLWEHDQRLFRAVYTEQTRARLSASIEAFFSERFEGRWGDVREDVLRVEFAYKMVDDFLSNEDRTSMANGLEVRVPFLDRALVEYAFSIPASVKFHRGELKCVLRRAMADVLPAHTLHKPKWGFTFDAYGQFRKDLRETARRELTEPFLREQGLFRPEFVRAVIEAEPHPRMRWHYFLLWLILGMKVWQRLFLEGVSVEACYEHG
jgi:asparagine synthase (glutamine-hydrolysing)